MRTQCAGTDCDRSTVSTLWRWLSSTSRARWPLRRASWARQNAQASALALVARLEAAGSRPASALDHLRMHHRVERAVEQHPRPQPRQRPEAVGRHRAAAQRLEQRRRPALPCALTSSRSRLAAARHISASSFGVRLDAGLALGGQQGRPQAVEQGLLQRRVQAAGHAPPHDPVVGPALRQPRRDRPAGFGARGACSIFHSCSTRNRSSGSPKPGRRQ